MTAKIIDGKNLSVQIKAEIASKITALDKAPCLAVILVGNDEASLVYDRNKQKAAQTVGMDCEFYHLEEQTKEPELLDLISRLNNDSHVNGIIVQLPLPKHLDTKKILEAVAPKKDVDGFNPVNAGRLQSKDSEAFVSATPRGVLFMLQSVCSDLSGKNVVIIGRSNIVGRPLASLLLNHDCTVTVTHSKTKNIQDFTKNADIVIAACGCPKMVKKEGIKDGAIVIDVGINRIDGKLCGDVDFEDVLSVAGYVTPVPGGVGPMTIAMLLENTYDAYLKQNGIVKK